MPAPKAHIDGVLVKNPREGHEDVTMTSVSTTVTDVSLS